MNGLERLQELAAADRYLAVLVTQNADGSPQVSVVNCGVIDHPLTGAPCVALVARNGAKVTNVRRHPLATLVVRAGWEWIAVRGETTVIGPGESLPDDAFARLLRDIFHAAGGHHDDLRVYDEVMAAERRCAVLIAPDRFTSNPPDAEHQEPAP